MVELPAAACHEKIITQRFVELRKVLGLSQAKYAKLFQMSRQAFSKLEKYQEGQKMNYSTIFMISYTLSAIINHKNFDSMQENQKDKIIEIKDITDSYLNKETKCEDIINQLFSLNNM